MSNIQLLKTSSKPVAPVDTALVARLKEITAMAEDGKIQGLAYVTIQSVGSGHYSGTGTGWVGDGVYQNIHTTLGVVAVLNRRLLEAEADA